MPELQWDQIDIIQNSTTDIVVHLNGAGERIGFAFREAVWLSTSDGDVPGDAGPDVSWQPSKQMTFRWTPRSPGTQTMTIHAGLLDYSSPSSAVVLMSHTWTVNVIPQLTSILVRTVPLRYEETVALTILVPMSFPESVLNVRVNDGTELLHYEVQNQRTTIDWPTRTIGTLVMEVSSPADDFVQTFVYRVGKWRPSLSASLEDDVALRVRVADGYHVAVVHVMCDGSSIALALGDDGTGIHHFAQPPRNVVVRIPQDRYNQGAMVSLR